MQKNKLAYWILTNPQQDAMYILANYYLQRKMLNGKVETRCCGDDWEVSPLAAGADWGISHSYDEQLAKLSPDYGFGTPFAAYEVVDRSEKWTKQELGIKAFGDNVAELFLSSDSESVLSMLPIFAFCLCAVSRDQASR